MKLLDRPRFLDVLDITSGGSSGLSSTDGERTVDQVFAQLGLTHDMKLKPQLLQEIIAKDMFLDEFSPLTTKLSKLFQSEISAEPMLESIRLGILHRHPAIIDFFGVAIKNNLFAEAKNIKSQVERIVHHTFLLEIIVQEMACLTFMTKLHDYFDRLKQSHGIRTSWRGEFFDVRQLTGSFFQAAKMVTVDKKTIAQYIDFRTRKSLGKKDLTAKNKGLFLNIKEARLADLVGGFYHNATVAAVLADSRVKKLWVKGDDTQGVVLQEFAEGWPSLYETWNLAFVLGNLVDLPIILPKLLVPSVINAEPDEYLYYRGLALWVTTNCILQKRLHGIKPIKTPPLFKTIAHVWGEINVKYAEKFVALHAGHASIKNYRPGIFWSILQRRFGTS